MRLTPLGRLCLTLVFTVLIIVMCLAVVFVPPGWWLR